MATRPYTVEQILEILSNTPRYLAELMTNLAPFKFHAPPSDGEWSINEVLAHLRACGDVWGGHIHKIFTEDQPHVRGVSPTTWSFSPLC